ncbi:hypothetical protein G7075_18935 [Phycicoccus sp. HDW14]|uniref:hypothetical protein n=1 Tax=Phycicoccus sp. HDW14 TaxID=2714941 RepID=UPI00140A71A9|nr:hypothetical protein [Phycicoccus sp. HDW14]QIM22731.1 hypothetical protein G7075_18935 [Phycicoccus sp. HDW14]
MATGSLTAVPRGRWTPGPDGRWDPRRSDRVFGTVMVALWVAWLVLTLVTQTRLVTPDRLEADLAAGRVVTWQVVQLDTSDEGSSWSRGVDFAVTVPSIDASVDDAFSAPGSPAIAYWTDGWFAPVRVLDPSGLALGPHEVAQWMRTAGVPTADRLEDPTIVFDRRQNWVVSAAAPLLLMFLGSVLIGPAPTRGTRWFWFWQAWVTFGLGVLAYAVWEQLRPAPRPGTLGAPARMGGWRGLFVAILVSAIVGALVSALAGSTHWLWLVRP